VTVISALVAMNLYWRWLAEHGLEGTARLVAFASLAVYPYAWFLYGVVYADATFMMLALAAVLLVERDRVLLGALAGALATACRPTGLALVPALLLLAADRQGILGPWTPSHTDPAGRVGRALRWVHDWLRVPGSIDRDRITAGSFLPLLSLAGVGAYAGYLWWRFGEPLVFLTNQATFHGRFPILKLTFMSRLVHVADTPLLTSTLTLQAAFMAGTLASAGAVSRRFGFPYGVLIVAAVAIPFAGSHDFMGTGRYLLLAFPTFALVGERLARRPKAALALLGASAAIMLVMAFGFSRSVYLS
jgi:hypothetical protein